MGKVRNALRNPPVTIEALEDSRWEDGHVVHMGQELVVIRNGARHGRSWILKSKQGVKYSARAESSGKIRVELMGLM